MSLGYFQVCLYLGAFSCTDFFPYDVDLGASPFEVSRNLGTWLITQNEKEEGRNQALLIGLHQKAHWEVDVVMAVTS